MTLLARSLTVGLPVAWLPTLFKLPAGSARVLVWGGLRGGISVALALSLPAGPERNIVLALTYAVVVFSILAQGLSIGHVIRSALAHSTSRKAEDTQKILKTPYSTRAMSEGLKPRSAALPFLARKPRALLRLRISSVSSRGLAPRPTPVMRMLRV